MTKESSVPTSTDHAKRLTIRQKLYVKDELLKQKKGYFKSLRRSIAADLARTTRLKGHTIQQWRSFPRTKRSYYDLVGASTKIKDVGQRRLMVDAMMAYARQSQKDVDLEAAKTDIKALMRTIVQEIDPMADFGRQRTLFAVRMMKLTSQARCLTIDDTTMRLGSIVIKRQIGSKSAYGMAFLARGKGVQAVLNLAVKIMEDNVQHVQEVMVLQRWTALVRQKKAVNLAVMYDARRCNQPCESPACPTPTRSKYLIVFNELATGDLAMWASDASHTSQQWCNMLFQIMAGLHAMHTWCRLAHRDTHWGNFLYHKIQSGGCWHYKTREGQDAYIPNLGFLFVLWDPSGTEPISKTSVYYDVHWALTNADHMSTYRDRIPTQIQKLLSKVQLYIQAVYTSNQGGLDLASCVLKLMMHCGLVQRQPAGVIINSKPIII